MRGVIQTSVKLCVLCASVLKKSTNPDNQKCAHSKKNNYLYDLIHKIMYFCTEYKAKGYEVFGTVS